MALVSLSVSALFIMRSDLWHVPPVGLHVATLNVSVENVLSATGSTASGWMQVSDAVWHVQCSRHWQMITDGLVLLVCCAAYCKCVQHTVSVCSACLVGFTTNRVLV